MKIGGLDTLAKNARYSTTEGWLKFILHHSTFILSPLC